MEYVCQARGCANKFDIRDNAGMKRHCVLCAQGKEHLAGTSWNQTVRCLDCIEAAITMDVLGG